MAYDNRDLIRKPHAMLRINRPEEEDFEWLVDNWGNGGAPAEVYREFILECIRAKRHERNSLAAQRLDKNAFGGWATA